jgi:dipeptidyl aminopeptidase/acylaminoacyl peptidase
MLLVKVCPIKAAATIGAFSDLQELIDSHPQQYSLAMLSQFFPNYETRKSEIAKTRSSIFWPERLNVPLLIMHGGADSLNPAQSLMLAQQLQKLGKVYELIIYAEDNHNLSKNQEDSNRRAISWFKRYMKN